jgi:hypothetical protein
MKSAVYSYGNTGSKNLTSRNILKKVNSFLYENLRSEKGAVFKTVL